MAGYLGQKPTPSPLTTADLGDGIVTAAKLAPGAADTQRLEYNQAILAFKLAAQNSLAKFSMVDQVIDEYQDATGVDTTASIGELAGGATTAKYYAGGTSTTPTVTEDADYTGTVGDYTWYKWTVVGAGTFSIDVTQAVEYLIVGGGGSGGLGNSGGAGAGGYLANGSAALSLTGGNTYTITVGAGGASVTSNGIGNVGGNSVLSGTGISTLTAGGGGYGSTYGAAGGNGGSGGGGGYNGNAGGTATGVGLGYAGGVGGGSVGPAYGSGGGGGAGAVGEAGGGSKAGDGGIGLQNDITGTNTWYAGGGGGAADNLTASSGNQSTGAHGGTQGGGGKGSSRDSSVSTTYNDAEPNTGGGGGGAFNPPGTSNSGDGGSGVVVIRKLTTITTVGGNLTLQSVATTAETAPTKADLVLLIEDASGTATINTDIKAKVSRDGTAFSGYVTFVDEGDWGTNKRILVARQVDISGITSGTSMKYKIETLNQSAGVKETRIHATSLAWS
jgi:hypothetical protein